MRIDLTEARVQVGRLFCFLFSVKASIKKLISKFV